MDLSLRNSKDDFMRTVDINNSTGCLCGSEEKLVDRCGAHHAQQTSTNSDITVKTVNRGAMTAEDSWETSENGAEKDKGQMSVKLKQGRPLHSEGNTNSVSKQTSNSDPLSSAEVLTDEINLKGLTCQQREGELTDSMSDSNTERRKSQHDHKPSPKDTLQAQFFLGNEEVQSENASPDVNVPSRLSSRLSSIDEGKALSSEDMESEPPLFPVNVEFNADSTVSVELPPCECDDCQLSEQDEVTQKKGMTLLKRQSSWKIIRSIVRWSPFVQVFKKNKYPWIQLAGHQGNFQAGESGAVLKKLDSREKQCYLKLMTDTLYPFVPEYRGDTEKSGEKYIQLQDLLCEFTSPCVMDVKMGCRTYLEEELEKARSKPTLRKDMYKKMVEVDPNAPTQEEREKEGVTKARYLQWRDEMSSSVNLGFRIEGIKKSDGSSSKDFKKTKTRDHVYDKLKSFIGENTNAISQYIERLKAIRDAQGESEFFQRHEVISSSLLFVHDAEKANIWMIDFGKTEPLPASINIDHRSQWCEGNHEDGYLSGLDGLLSILTDLLNES